MEALIPSVVGAVVFLLLLCALIYWHRARCRPLFGTQHAAVERDEFSNLDRLVPTLFRYQMREQQEEMFRNKLQIFQVSCKYACARCWSF